VADLRSSLQPDDALIVVDVQRDFCEGGALAIPEGDTVVPILNRWIRAADANGVAVYASRDWHPLRHPSFVELGGPWPAHCVQDTPGAAFHAELALTPSAIVVTKGTRFDRDQNSAFDGTGLEAELHRRRIRRLWLGGLAQDVCVCATVLDARRHGFETVVIAHGTMPVTREGFARAEQQMRDAGATFTTTG
jgi:nicotinamidase/pyrazinamidase